MLNGLNHRDRFFVWQEHDQDKLLVWVGSAMTKEQHSQIATVRPWKWADFWLCKDVGLLVVHGVNEHGFFLTGGLKDDEIQNQPEAILQRFDPELSAVNRGLFLPGKAVFLLLVTGGHLSKRWGK